MKSPSAYLERTPSESVGVRWRDSDAMRRLAGALMIDLGVAMATGLALMFDFRHDAFLHLLVAVHLASGALALFFFTAFVAWHWRDCRETLARLLFPFLLLHRKDDPYALRRLQGYLLMWPMLGVLATGLLIALPAVAYLAGNPQTLPYGLSESLRLGHRWLSLLLPLAMWGHLARKKGEHA